MHVFYWRRLIPSDASGSARTVGLLCLTGTVVGWGINWPVMKLIFREWPPLFARGVAGLIASLLLFAVARARRERLFVPRHSLRDVIRASAFNVFAWMGFPSLSLLWLRVSEGALLVYTMPIWVMLLSWPFLGVRPTLRSVLALVLGVAGIVVLLAAQPIEIGASKLPGVALALTAAVLFAYSTVTTRTPIAMPPVALTAWQVGLGSLPMVVFGLIFEKPKFGALSPVGWAGMAYMTAVPMGACYLGWFAALRRLPPGTASSGTLLVPAIGVISAAAMLREPLGMREIFALFLTLSGVMLSLRKV